MLYDTHCHPYLNKVKNQDTVILDFFKNWWKYINIIWTDLKTSEIAIKYANKFSWVYCTIWIHPCDVYNLELDNTINLLEKLYLDNKENVVWIWECWLDYYWIYNDEETNKLQEKYKNKIIEWKKILQKIFFKAQILLAKKYNLPIIIHNRNSKDDVFEILKDMNFKNFIFHCYSENLDYANKLIKFAPECKISFSGIITFKNAKEIQETAKNINIKHILVETDSPYLTPIPFRWKEENEPIYTKHVVEKVNELRWKDCSSEIFNNSLKIFNIKK